jgi:hypothetical protein
MLLGFSFGKVGMDVGGLTEEFLAEVLSKLRFTRSLRTG